MDKRQAEAIANAMLTRDDAVNANRRGDFGHGKYGKFERRILIVCIAVGAMTSSGAHHFFLGSRAEGSTFLMVAEGGAMAAVLMGVVFISWRRFLATRVRKRSIRQRMQQELAAHK